MSLITQFANCTIDVAPSPDPGMRVLTITDKATQDAWLFMFPTDQAVTLAQKLTQGVELPKMDMEQLQKAMQAAGGGDLSKLAGGVDLSALGAQPPAPGPAGDPETEAAPEPAPAEEPPPGMARRDATTEAGGNDAA